ncbi:flagellin [Blastococcus sp. CT_GayMR16]|uniref:flagellin N-terminal helical domain-containing protein n=1 Tax=Blastococcus sp. CT_GayMR16 TaxID=2559607 RepID=UPI0010734902|nr:flagellin [Blastococcus sp. CT_GayMR16]TFV83315.1 flagellin [Blastococcus sp. CT_GayMR16]
MGLRVNNNIAALNAYRNLSVTDGQMSKSLEKLSSGFRINRAADDAAGLAISEGLRSQIGGLKVAVRNTQDGISVVQTAEGALTETHSILQRMRDLAVQGSNDGGLNTDAKGNIQSEITQLKSELDRIASSTTFNGKKLLDGSYQASFQVGANAGETIAVSIGTAMGAAGLKVDGVDVTGAGAFAFQTGTAAASGKAVISTAATTAAAAVMTITETTAGSAADWSTGSGSVAAYQSLSGTIGFGGKTLDLGAVDYGSATTATQALAALNTAAQAAFGLASGVNPFAGSTTGVTFTVPAVAVAGYTTASGFALSSSAGDVAKATPTFTAASGADAAIDLLDTAIKKVSTQRADLGAIQNRFDHTINNLNVAVENLTASESRIRDADMAQEMVQFTRNQILSQAGTAMLAQANQASQGVLQLLQG